MQGSHFYLVLMCHLYLAPYTAHVNTGVQALGTHFDWTAWTAAERSLALAVIRSPSKTEKITEKKCIEYAQYLFGAFLEGYGS